MRTLYYVKADELVRVLPGPRSAGSGKRRSPIHFNLAPCWLGLASTSLISLRTASRKDRRASRLRCVGMEVEYEQD
jgi:hypothetical protein